MTRRLSLAFLPLLFARPLSAQLQTPQTPPSVAAGMEVQVKRATDTAWVAAKVGEIMGSARSCLLVRLAPPDADTGDYMLTSFKAFVAVRFKDAQGRWQDLPDAELRTLQQCTTS